MGFVVAAIVNEPRAIIDRFVNWYLSQGAEQIILYFDNPRDDIIPNLEGTPGVSIIRCTSEFWRNIDIDPTTRFTARQNAAVNHAYQTLTAEWLLNVDADELMYFSECTISDKLSSVTADVSSIRVASAEHVLTDAEGEWFRLQMPRKEVNRLHGQDAALFRPRYGLVGHADGKSFHRRGLTNIRLRQHWAEDDKGEKIPALRLGAAEHAYLLHYMAPHYDLWRAKIEWRLGSHGFSAPMKERIRVLQAQSDTEAFYPDLYRRMHYLSPEMHHALIGSGYLFKSPFNLAL